MRIILITPGNGTSSKVHGRISSWMDSLNQWRNNYMDEVIFTTAFQQDDVLYVHEFNC